ncbi:MAG TPA: 2-oxoglutarate and iron-dependent oxygenase domain-containing protein [Acetobacteraceae bacterium]|jgi:isopenicillin N synthase-like dioxygenase|nr:2-oxoglutarate and iron-dependent oxygenase domain-containing protein [Acetobacteraceae bacterium]
MLPIIDFAAVRAHDDAGTRVAADAIRAACLTDGFFYITNHGVSDDVIAAAHAAGQRFFRQPLEIKRLAAVNARHRGFNALGDALMYAARKPDHKEFYSIGLDLPEDDPDVLAGEKLRGPNNWPPGMPAFRAALEAYYAAMLGCGADLMRAVAVSLDLAPDFFVARYRKPLQRTQIVYYPPQPPDLDNDQFGVAPHSDFGCITLLWQDDIGGLEVLERSTQRWIPAPPIPGTLVINVADLLARWTNDRYASTPHRVINRSGRERLSIATFHDPDFKALVAPRELGTPAAECRYEPILAGEHIVGRIERSFGYRRQFIAAH